MIFVIWRAELQPRGERRCGVYERMRMYHDCECEYVCQGGCRRGARRRQAREAMRHIRSLCDTASSPRPTFHSWFHTGTTASGHEMRKHLKRHSSKTKGVSKRIAKTKQLGSNFAKSQQIRVCEKISIGERNANANLRAKISIDVVKIRKSKERIRMKMKGNSTKLCEYKSIRPKCGSKCNTKIARRDTPCSESLNSHRKRVACE